MSDVITERDGGVVTLTLNRPQARSALSDDMIRSLDSAFASGERDESVRAYVIRGAGDHFMAGGDVKDFQMSVSLSITPPLNVIYRPTERAA